MDKLQLLELIKDVPFFKNFTLPEKHYLSTTDSQVIRYHSNEHIINEGDMECALYIILKGDVGVTKNVIPLDGAKKPKKTLLTKLVPGAVFGEVSLISKRSRTTSVHAIGEVIVLRMDGKMMETLEPKFMNKLQAKLIDLLVQRLDTVNNQLSDLMQWQRS